MIAMTEPTTIETPSSQTQTQEVPFTDGPLRPKLNRLTKVSIVIPVYNEEQYVQDLVRLVVKAPLPEGVEREIICVNDCSKDRTADKLDSSHQLFPDTDSRSSHKPVNEGKGAALRDGFKLAKGDAVLIQDADLEYDPQDYMKLVQPIYDDKADVVYGSRFIGEPHRVLYYYHTLGNKFLTTMSNMFTNLNLTDMEVCYKVFRKSVLAQDHHQVQPLRLRTRNHRQNRQNAPPPPHLRGRRRLLRPQLRRGQKNHLERWHQSHPDNYPIQI
jgi:glycosyltransferase involved in cell wall biosynthesis